MSILELEITVLSVEGLHHYSPPFTALFSTPITPFIKLTKIPPTNGDKPSHVYTSKAPAWDREFRVPLDSTFLSDRYSAIHLQLHSKRRILGPAQLGWCLIPASDIGFLPSGSLRHLSYRLRAKDGSRGHGIINLSIRLATPTVDACQTVIGMPVTAIRGMGDREKNEVGKKVMMMMMMRDEGGPTARQRDSRKPLSEMEA